MLKRFRRTRQRFRRTRRLKRVADGVMLTIAGKRRKQVHFNVEGAPYGAGLLLADTAEAGMASLRLALDRSSDEELTNAVRALTWWLIASAAEFTTGDAMYGRQLADDLVPVDPILRQRFTLGEESGLPDVDAAYDRTVAILLDDDAELEAREDARARARRHGEGGTGPWALYAVAHIEALASAPRRIS